MKKIQRALGRNVEAAHPTVIAAGQPWETIGQAVMDAVERYVEWGLQHDDGSTLAQSIHSLNLRKSASFSARSARIAYMLGKAALLDAQSRKGIVRTQIIEFGSVAEAILLDVIQSVGVSDTPPGLRPSADQRGATINWRQQGLFATTATSQVMQLYRFDFHWLTNQAERVGAIDAGLKRSVHWLRKSRNLIHPVIPTPARYKSDLDSSKSARDVVIRLRDSILAFKKKHGLP